MKIKWSLTNMIIQSFSFYVLVVVLTGLSMSSCDKRPDLKDVKINSRYTLIIPQYGCPGCISQGKRFAKEHLNSSCFTIVFTKIQDLKKLKIDFGYKEVEAPNVFLDTENTLEGYVEGYPVMITENEKIALDNSGFHHYRDLEKDLAECK
ncbi:hypothetical protein KZP23_19605 [Echinicola marina]|uniref:hypothetical protein n=1 Tax=Echinicola marina TaxID=2859768 RepID=UPI001CF62822|nr:hypothetical protein [Echinicola marina]UCS92852.1 hypothetical protein KZP23_19605 [Echinicola marina]